MRILHLTLKKKWFNMVGPDKPEEYREIKGYWATRLLHGFKKNDYHFLLSDLKKPYESSGGGTLFDAVKKEFDVVEFKNGYGKNAPIKRFNWQGMDMRTGNPAWGAEPGKEYFVIKLGELLTTPQGEQNKRYDNDRPYNTG